MKQNKLTNVDLLKRYRQVKISYWYRHINDNRDSNFMRIDRYYPVENKLGLDLFVFKDQFGIWQIVDGLSGYRVLSGGYRGSKKACIEHFNSLWDGKKNDYYLDILCTKIKLDGVSPRYAEWGKEPFNAVAEEIYNESRK